MSKYFKTAILGLLSMVVISSSASAQTMYEYKQLDGTNSQKNNVQAKGDPIKHEKDEPNNPKPIPFDGGLSLVLAAGAGLAIKKRFNKKKVDVQVDKG